VAIVSNGLASCTSGVKHFMVQHEDPTRHFVFVDTPGFNDTWQDDESTLAKIIDWLTNS
jgi:predicted GTPase